MPTIDALKSKNTLITVASVAGALAVDAVLGRRGKNLSNVVKKAPQASGDLVEDLREGVSSVARKAKENVPAGSRASASESGHGQTVDGADGELGLDELAERRRQRRERRDQRRKAS